MGVADELWKEWVEGRAPPARVAEKHGTEGCRDGTNGSERRTSERGSGRTRCARGRGWKLESRRRWAPRGWTRTGETGTGTRERRNTNRLDVDGGVGVGPDMAEASRLPEVAKEMKCLPAGEAALPTPVSFYRLPPTGTDVPRQDFQSSPLSREHSEGGGGWRRWRSG